MSYQNSSTIPAIVPINPLPPPPSKLTPRQDSTSSQREQFIASASGSASNSPGGAPLNFPYLVPSSSASSNAFSAISMDPYPVPMPRTHVGLNAVAPTAHTNEVEHDLAELASEDSGSESDSESSSEGEPGNEDAHKEASDKLSSKISNRSSPSVLSASIHQWPGYEEESHGLLENPEEESEVSENDDPEDPWKIQPEQRGWYLSLFLRLQPDIHNFIEGKDARVFFENSNLPLSDLGEIWGLSDLDRDGRLTLTEFCYAMHLSVARRHHLTLPPQLPPSLRSSTRYIVKAATESIGRPNAVDQSAHQSEWTQFGESPRNRGPVQFRNAAENDKSLPHPIPTRPSVEQSLQNNSARLPPARDTRSFSAGTVPSPYHPPSLHANTPGTALPGVPEVAPPPPPRSWHSRSASLDLQGLPPGSQPGSGQPKVLPSQPPPPQLPPRSSPTLGKRLDSATSESENEVKRPSHLVAAQEIRPEKPPRVTKTTPNKNVTFSHPPSAASQNVPAAATFSLPVIINVDIPIPTVQQLGKMSPEAIADVLRQFRNVVEGLSKQNIDLQQQLTEVVLKKRTAESQLNAGSQKDKSK